MTAAGAIERRVPTTGTAGFESGDDGLDRVWRVGVRTLELCSYDAFMDCPGREQQAWIGDAYLHGLVTMVANGDWRLVRRHLRLAAQSARPDGFLAMAAAGGTSLISFNIPEYSAHWVRMLARYVEYSGDVATARSLLPAATTVMESFERHLDVDGLIHHLPGIVFVDWAQTERGEVTGAVDALYGVALLDYAWLLEHAVGDDLGAAETRIRHASLAAGFEALWDEERGAYVDALHDDGPGRRMSQQTNALAIVGRMAPEDRWARMLDRVTDPEHVKRTLSNGDLPSWQHWSYQWWDPAESVGFDAEHHVVEAQPFMTHFLHQALAAADRYDDVLAGCRRWIAQIDRGNTTFEEFWDVPPGTTSRCHAWSATPTYDLTTHVLGVRPTTPGYKTATITPRFGSLSRLAGRVPTPRGEIVIDVTRDGGSIIVPDGVRATVSFPDAELAETELGVGTHSVA